MTSIEERFYVNFLTLPKVKVWKLTGHGFRAYDAAVKMYKNYAEFTTERHVNVFGYDLVSTGENYVVYYNYYDALNHMITWEFHD